MDDELRALAAGHPAGLVTARRLVEVGWAPTSIQRMTRDGALARVRRGVYAPRAAWEAAGPDERFRMRIHAESLQADGPLVVSHRAAAAMHRLPAAVPWPEAIETFFAGATGGRSGGRRSVRRVGPEPEVELVDGVAVTSLTRTLADVATTQSWRWSVPMLDAALRAAVLGAGGGRRPREPFDAMDAAAPMRARVYAEIECLGRRRGRRRAEASVAFADPLAENAGESLSRVVIHELGFEAPELQVRFEEVFDGAAVVDFLWRRLRRIGEFDGRLKYTRSRAISGRDAGSVVFREKQREDALRRLGFGVVRWGWSTLHDPAGFAARLRAAGVPQR
ncbi:type IV toxin-antitoxin system AbiEi family antitoxin domain-containing protein [Agromyces sp. LHK192]|uniref:type IV toxin-antitoxin system AbiEi family antitoxin domain-containing protein n=1 Tax=Agromyces sp. LHK192 TaxID=2498704 RepID=UPI0013E3542D|nr:type IV toxin-antitoxin system AbiEi family antitoxin domain-containing protein [Agromyces sp. LHK192]